MSKATKRFVLVLDVSRSMAGRPLEILKQASQLFIKDLISDNSYLGIVEFGAGALCSFPLSRINSGKRQAAAYSIQRLNHRRGTSIGSGLLLALQVLRDGYQPTEGARLIMLTDGGENRNPRIAHVLPQLLQAKVKVFAVALGVNADRKLEALARDTNGKCYMFQNITGRSTAELNRIFLEASDVDGDRLGLMSKQHVVKDGTTDVRIVVDKDLGKNAMFVISSKDIRAVDAELIGPNGEKYNLASKECSRDEDQAKRVIYKLPQATPGEWNLKIKCKDESDDVAVDVNVCSEAANSGKEPISVRSWMSSTNVQYPDVPKIFAHVTKGSGAILQADVQATVTSDTGKKMTIALKDGGTGDGFYFADFTPFDEKARRYNITAEVKSTAQTTLAGPNTSNMAICPFIRTASAGSVAVKK